MKYTIAELTRFIGYIAGVIVGLAFVGYGLATGDLATALAGASSIGVSVVAAPNVSKTAVAAIPDSFEAETPALEYVGQPDRVAQHAEV